MSSPVSFGTLYDYQNKNGITIPQTSTIKSTVESAFKTIFGSDLDTSEETPVGRLIEAITVLFVDICGVNAQNANGMNVIKAVGMYLDSLGENFGISRFVYENGVIETDDSYRRRIINSCSRGTGYSQSIMNAVAKVTGVHNVCVLENGNSENKTLPDAEIGIGVPAHSVFVSVVNPTDADGVANAIYNTKSAGCGYANIDDIAPEMANRKITRLITNAESSSNNTVVFYNAAKKNLNMIVSVYGQLYTGNDIVADVRNAIKTGLRYWMCRTMTAADVVTAIASANIGVICSGAILRVNTYQYEKISVYPYEYIDLSDNDITVVLND